MLNKKIGKIFLVIFLILIGFYFFYSKFFSKDKIIKAEIEEIEENLYSSNVINDVSYTTKDTNGNEYLIKALIGEIDFNNSQIIYLTKVQALIKLKNSNLITITSDFGKYNINNYDTIFSKDVIISYLDNNIKGEYLDFSLNRSTMIISRDVVYNNMVNTLNADVIEMNIKTKDVKIFMYEEDKKVKIQNKN
tara:strand:+ start:344 stop:919 length:576 start_codon:yes stop_codon:yes gene_type:complete